MGSSSSLNTWAFGNMVISQQVLCKELMQMLAAARVWRIQSLAGADLTLSSVITIRMNNTQTHTQTLFHTFFLALRKWKPEENYRVFSDEWFWSIRHSLCLFICCSLLQLSSSYSIVWFELATDNEYLIALTLGMDGPPNHSGGLWTGSEWIHNFRKYVTQLKVDEWSHRKVIEMNICVGYQLDG